MTAGPAGPVDPVGQVGPVGPVGPVGQVGPVGHVRPVDPVGQVGSVGPVGPVDPVGPVGSVGPVGRWPAVTPPLFPVGLVVAGRPCLVVGGGPVAARKAAGLAACGATVTVVAPAVVPAVDGLDGVRVERRPYRRGEAAGYRLVVTATGDRVVDQAVFDDADAAGVWVNSADDPERCSFTLPAVVRRGPVTVAVATGGASPALAAWLRARLAAALPPDLDAIVAALADARTEARRWIGSTEGIDWPAVIDEMASPGDADPADPADQADQADSADPTEIRAASHPGGGAPSEFAGGCGDGDGDGDGDGLVAGSSGRRAG